MKIFCRSSISRIGCFVLTWCKKITLAANLDSPAPQYIRFLRIFKTSGTRIEYSRYLYLAAANLTTAFTRCGYITVDLETHTYQNGIWSYKLSFHRKINIIRDQNIKFWLPKFFLFEEPLWDKILTWQICWVKQIPFSDVRIVSWKGDFYAEKETFTLRNHLFSVHTFY